ncbi:MAG: dicarboxylate/amino acid:cation symporter [bacterium]
MKKVSLAAKVFIAMIAGYALGLVVGTPIVPYLQPIGDVFIRLIKMLVAPLIFFSITAGVASMNDIRRFGRVGGKIFGLYMGTSALAVLIGLIMALIVKPGIGFVMDTAAKPVEREIPSIIDSIIKMVPDNPIAALANMDMVQVIVFSIFLGASIILMGEAGRAVADLFQKLTDAMTNMTVIVMETAPFGVFALMAVTGAKYGFSVLLPLAKFFAAEYLAMAFQFFITYSLILQLIAKVNPFQFLKKVIPVIVMTMSTTSSNATLPVSMRVADEELGVSRDIYSFTLPFGATVNLDGAALNIPISVLFTAQIFGMQMTAGHIFTLLFSALVMSVGAAGIPGGAIVFILIMLGQFGLPTEAFALVIAVYRIIDMGLTTINVIGDMVCTTAVAASEGELDRSKWIPSRVSIQA